MTQSRVWAGLYDAATDMLNLRFWLEDGERRLDLEGLHSGAAGLGGVVARTGRSIATPDYVAECERVASRPDAPVGFDLQYQMPWVGVPLMSGGLVLGVLSVSQKRGEPFDATLVELLETLASHSSMAVENLALRAEDALRRVEMQAHAAENAESELRYRLLFEHNPHPMWVFDLETLIFLAVNAAAVRQYGYSRDEFLAMQVSAMRLPEDLPAFVARIRQPESTAGVWTHRKKDGAHITVDIFSYPIVFAHRNARFSVITDITDHQRAVAALRQSQIWRRQGVNLTMAVNLSMRTLHDPRLPATVAGLLERWNVPAHVLHLEITESSLMADPARALEILERLRVMGVGIAIDDFGTGYSSLAYLKRLPVSDLKIDRSFVLDMVTDESARVIVHSTIDLAHNLGLRVIAKVLKTPRPGPCSRTLAVTRCKASTSAGRYQQPNFAPG